MSGSTLFGMTGADVAHHCVVQEGALATDASAEPRSEIFCRPAFSIASCTASTRDVCPPPIPI